VGKNPAIIIVALQIADEGLNIMREVVGLGYSKQFTDGIITVDLPKR
jgi:hypothetical protein